MGTRYDSLASACCHGRRGTDRDLSTHPAPDCPVHQEARAELDRAIAAKCALDIPAAESYPSFASCFEAWRVQEFAGIAGRQIARTRNVMPTEINTPCSRMVTL